MGWSKEQISAIESHGTNELVNAGAGSGKTAVLSEHVIYLLKNHGYNLADFLIVTFTNDAANEMKQRIRKKLLSDPELKYLADQIEATHIQTFDAFYLFLVKKYAAHLKLNDDIKIIDSAILNVEIRRVIESLFADLYKNRDEQFIDLVTHLCVKDDYAIKEAIIKLYEVSSKAIDDNEYLENYINNYYSDSFVNYLISSLKQEVVERINMLIAQAQDLEVKEDSDSIVDYLSSFMNIEKYDDLYNGLINASLPRKLSKYQYSDITPRKKITDYFGINIRNFVKNFGDSNSIKENYLGQQKYVEIIVNLTKIVKKRLNSFKYEHNLFEFIDIARFALALMKDDVIAKEVKSTFKYIMVDEYQDTNDIQEMMINLLGQNNVFMVGDVKQSIYRFNNSNCEIFESKYQKYKWEQGGHKIDMTKNYRSRKEFMDDLNLMFSLLMSKNHNPISYVDGHISKPGNDDYATCVDINSEYGIKAITYSTETFIDKASINEASIIAEDILSKMQKGIKVYDKEDCCLRDAKFSDFAIIVDRGTEFDNFKTVFSKYKIPLFVQDDEKLLYSDVSLVIKNLLVLVNGVKNECYDESFKRSFVSIARSFLKQYEDSFIYQIIKDGSYIFDDIVVTIKQLISSGQVFNLRSLLIGLYDVFEIEKRLLFTGDINNNLYFLDYFLSLADNLDSLHRGLVDFITLFEDMMNFDLTLKSPPIKDVDDSVLLINIHKSKGREFPICYFPLLNKKFNRQENTASIYVEKNHGMALGPLFNEKEKIINKAISACKENRSDIEEKIRLLYVAITRARESAILVYPDIETKKIYRMSDCKSMFDILSFAPLARNKIAFKSSLDNSVYVGKKTENKLTFRLIEKTVHEHEEIIEARASKELDSNVAIDALKYGQKLHYLLELVDFRTKNTDFIKNEKHKAIINKVLSNPIFDLKDNDIILHEYAYHDEVNNINGIIDCLIIKNDVIYIIDFKLKNLDDVNYNKQLLTYKNYIEQIKGDRSIKMYLLSIIDNNIREVKDE